MLLKSIKFISNPPAANQLVPLQKCSALIICGKNGAVQFCNVYKHQTRYALETKVIILC